MFSDAWPESRKRIDLLERTPRGDAAIQLCGKTRSQGAEQVGTSG